MSDVEDPESPVPAVDPRPRRRRRRVRVRWRRLVELLGDDRGRRARRTKKKRAEEKGEEEPSEAEARSGEGSLTAEGKEVFASNCGSCHTLKAAGTSGEVGPNLDELEPDLATVEHQVVNGGGGMPAFGKEGLLNAKEIKAVATYVSSVAGQG